MEAVLSHRPMLRIGIDLIPQLEHFRMGAELGLNLVQFLVSLQRQLQLQPALRSLYCHPVFVTQFHAASVTGGRGRLKEKWPALG